MDDPDIIRENGEETMKDLTRITTLLQSQRDTLLQRINAIEKAVRHHGEALDPDFAEQAVQRQNDEVLTALDDSSIVELRRVNEALQRMEEGEYGVCVDCGLEIPMERLEAIPYAERCIDCAELEDAQQ
jgi:RNA polymerase-binding protein DksA